jgi:glycerol-3-phosphate acyltransferase PlsY
MFIIYLLTAYIIGSFPTAIIAGRLLKRIDIRKHGSGNAGATNVFRVLGWKPGIIVLLIDMLKGFVVVYYLSAIVPGDSMDHSIVQVSGGLVSIFGHIFTIFANFKGGKGVGTAAGVFLGLELVPVLICLLAFVFTVWITRYVSLGSILASVMLPITIVLWSMILSSPLTKANIYISIILMITILITHRSNIKRLVNGQENKLSFGKSGDKS